MDISIPTIKFGRWGGIYSPMERAMAAHGVDTIGAHDYRQKNEARFIDERGEMRPASLDMSSDSRGLRTLMVRRLGNDQIERLHERERKLGFFIVAIERLFKMHYKPELINDERLEYLLEFNNAHRPVLRDVYGVRMMAYFPPDMEFDGMEYHQSWDKCVLLGDLVLPDIIRSRVKKKFGDPLDKERELL